ncbi:MAG TPA: tRNA-dihydrouridine synthase [Marinagarivorans sp.]
MRIFLAPMEGVVDHNIRQLYSTLGGIDAAVTEFVRVSQSRLPDAVFHRLCPELVAPIAIPVRVQLLGSDPVNLAEHAQRLAALGAVGIDLNFGCPAKTVNKSRGGACLLQEPRLLNEIASAVRAAVPPCTPVTAKMRLGFNAREGYLDTAQALADGGISELFVHGRSKVDGYKPPAYWGAIGEIQQALHIPVIANGELWTPEDVTQCIRESGCTDIMLGRGLLATPDLALAVKQQRLGNDYQLLSWHAILPKVWQYHLSTLQSYDPKYAGNRLKQWLMYLQIRYPEAKTFFEAIKRLRTADDLASAFHHYCKQYMPNSTSLGTRRQECALRA